MIGTPPRVTLVPLTPSELPAFRRRLQAAFAAGMVAAGLPADDEPIPSDAEILESVEAPGARTLHVVSDGERRGGAVVRIDDEHNVGHLDFFFVDESAQGLGIGAAAWAAIEDLFPSVDTWETMTPYFEQRNIHFYVNRCGFEIVEFYHPGHPDPHSPHHAGSAPGRHGSAEEEEPDLMFRFRKKLQ